MTGDNRVMVGRIVAGWWASLHPDENGNGGDCGALARLRRAAAPAEVLLEGEVAGLYGTVRKALGQDRLSNSQTAALATLAGVLASARPGASNNVRFATALGRTSEDRPPREDERPLMSPLRFGGLLRAQHWDERMRHLRRAAALLGNRTFDVIRFAEDVFFWNDEMRRRWIFEYHQQGRDAPGTEQTNEKETA